MSTATWMTTGPRMPSPLHTSVLRYRLPCAMRLLAAAVISFPDQPRPCPQQQPCGHQGGEAKRNSLPPMCYIDRSVFPLEQFPPLS